MIARFLGELTAALSFDLKLARRVSREFEDHLSEAVAVDSAPNRAEAERRAVARCGSPQAIAAELAVMSVAQGAKQLAFWLVLIVFGVLLAMKGHGAFYTMMHWGVPGEMQRVATSLGAVARYSFLTAIFIGAASWAYGIRSRDPSNYRHMKYSKHVNRFCFLAGIAAGALVICILVDAVLAAIRLAPLQPSAAFFVPIASIVSEMVGVAALIVLLGALLRRARYTARLQQV